MAGISQSGKLPAFTLASSPSSRRLHFLQLLPLARRALQRVGGVVHHGVERRIGLQHLLLLVQVEVHQAGLPVAENSVEHFQAQGIAGGLARQAEADEHVFGLRPHHFQGNRRRNGLFDGGLKRRHGLGRQRAERLVDDANGLVVVQVAAQAQGYVAGHVILAEILLNLRDGRILQVLNRADGRLRAVGVRGVERRIQRLVLLPAVGIKAAVFLLVHRLQLGVEQARHHLAHPLGLDGGPLLELVAGNVFLVYRFLVRGVGVGALRADGAHHLVVLVGHGIFSGHARDGVNLVVGALAGRGVVALAAVHFVKRLNLVQLHFFPSPVLRSQLRGALEHHVLQVVRQAGGGRRVVLRAGAHGQIGLDARGILVVRQVNRQAVIELIDADAQRVAGHRLVAVFFGSGRLGGGGSNSCGSRSNWLARLALGGKAQHRQRGK